MTEEEAKSMGDLFPDLGPEAPVISGIAHDRSEALATVRGVPNEPGMAAKVFTELATAGVNVDMIVQAGASVGTADISFTVPESAVKQVQNTLLDKQEVLGYHSFDVDTNVGKVAVVGVGMKTHAGLAAKFFQALSDEGINVLMISTSEIRIAALGRSISSTTPSRRCTPHTVSMPIKSKPWCTAVLAAEPLSRVFAVYTTKALLAEGFLSFGLSFNYFLVM